jgi:hypothetical protein
VHTLGEYPAIPTASLNSTAQRVLVPLRQVLRKIGCSDLLLIIYVSAVIRQYFWAVPDNRVTWTLAASASVLLGLFFVHKKELIVQKTSFRFWLIAALPVLLIYAARVPFPDFNYDVLNYHLVNTQRALHGWPMQPGDFFPGVLQVNPAPDIVDGIFQFGFGYRLGTIVNILAIFWTAQVLNELLRPYVSSESFRGVCVLFVVSTEHVLFLLNLYMVDLLALPLLLEATYLALRFHRAQRKDFTLFQTSLLLGLSTTFKLTNLAFVFPIAVLCIHNYFSFRPAIGLRYVVAAAAVFILPLVPFSLYMYAQTGSPVFPYYNKLFKSPFMEPTNYQVPWLGPKTLFERLMWPFFGVFHPERLSPMLGLSGYSGRVTIGYIFVLVGSLSRLVQGEIKTLCFVALGSFFLWIFTSGDIRYAIHLELLCGLVMVTILASLYRIYSEDRGDKVPFKALTLVALFVILFSVQTYASYRSALVHREYISEDSQSSRVVQPTIFDGLRRYENEAENLLRDRSSQKYLSAQERQILDNVDVWINSYEATSGIETTLKPDVPMLSVCDFFSIFDYLKTEASRERLSRTLEGLHGKRMFSVSNQAHLQDSKRFIERAGLKVGQITFLDVPFYSHQTKLRVALIEVLAPDTSSAENRPL